MNKKYAIIFMENNSQVVRGVLFESDDIKECLNEAIKLVFSGYTANRLRIVEVMQVSIKGQITCEGEKYASETFG